MFSSIDKAVVATVMGALYILNTLGGIDLGLSEETLGMFIGAATPILVWAFPNKPWA